MSPARCFVWIAATLAGVVASSAPTVAQQAVAPEPQPLRIELRQGGLVANVFRPAKEARYPAVLVLGGSGGGLSACTEEHAEALARRGMVAMDLAYFGMEGLASDLERLRSKGFAFPVEHVAYEDAGHLIGCVREDATKWGGTPEGMRKATADSKPRIVAFLAKALRAE